MAEDAAPEAEDLEEGEGPPPQPAGRKKLFIILGAVLFLLIAVAAGLHFSGIFEEEATLEPGDMPAGKIFYKLDPITLNLNAKGQAARFLQIGLTLVLVKETDVPIVEGMVPRITDYVVSYLRELSPEELEGSANFYRLRENVLLRVQAAAAPVLVTDVLFNSVFVQ